MSNKKNTAILTTVANFELYEKTSALFPQDIARYVIDGTNGMHSLHSIFYMFRKLKGKGIEWLIMADEDVIFVDNRKVFELIDYMRSSNFSICGVRDGGAISHRNQNPYSINTFFSILHFSKIEKIFNQREIKQNHYINSDEFEDDLSQSKSAFSKSSLFEPYYGFYFWLRRKDFNFLFLEAEMPFEDDPIANSVLTPNGDLLLYHTWYARAYGTNRKHTARINKILKENSEFEKTTSKPVIFKDKNFFFKELFRKNLRRIKLKLRT